MQKINKAFNGLECNTYFVTISMQEDVTLSGFRQHKQAAGTPAPLTSAEEELAELRRTEVSVGVGIDSRHQTLSGVAFPLTDSAWNAIEALATQHYNYIQLRIGNYLQGVYSTSELGFKS